MDYKTNGSISPAQKPSKILAIIALVVAFALPFLLIKSFHHKPREKTSSFTLTLPKKPPLEHNLQASNNTNEESSLPSVPHDLLANEKEWKFIKTQDGDTLAEVFKRAKVSNALMYKVLNEIPHAAELEKIKPNQEIQLLTTKRSLEQMILPLTSTQYLTISLQNGQYVSQVNSRKMNSHNHFITATVHGSLYATAKKQGIPFKLIYQMTDIFNWSIDFSRDVRDGDQFTIIYKAYYIEDKLVGTGEILAVSYRNRGNAFQAVRHADKSGQINYYTPEGFSLRKAFDRYPLRFSHISSTFNASRDHPILHHRRAHNGVDLAAHIGTPIHATGDGRVAFIGWQNGYGNMIKIRHNKTYSTVYGHMLKFKKGLGKGDFIKKDQIIGYVGQTGLATGPHCHYEFRINNQPKNPTTIDLPRSSPVNSRELASFRSHSNTLLAQLKLYEDGQLASAAAGQSKQDA